MGLNVQRGARVLRFGDIRPPEISSAEDCPPARLGHHFVSQAPDLEGVEILDPCNGEITFRGSGPEGSPEYILSCGP